MRSNSTPVDADGQLSIRTRAAQTAFMVLTSCVLGFAGVGCHSIYRQTAGIYPAKPCDRLKLRVDEARQAQQRAEEAAATLRKTLSKGFGGQTVETDVDRLEMTALEFERCVLATQDAAASCDEAEQFAAQIQRLQQRSKQLLEATRAIRRAGGALTASQLEILLGSPTTP